MTDLAEQIAIETERQLAERPLLWNVDLTIPAFLLRPSFTEIVQDRASELITMADDDDKETMARRESIAEELYKLATERL